MTVSAIEIIIHHAHIVGALICVGYAAGRGGHASRQALFALGASIPQTLLQCFKTGRLYKHVPRLYFAGLDVLHALLVKIQYRYNARVYQTRDALDTRSIRVASERCVL